MNRLFPHIVAVALLSTMLAATAGTMCLLPASAAHSPTAGCHPAGVPATPQPADYRCCVSHPSALLTGIFSLRPALQALEADTVDVPVAVSYSDAFPTALAGSSGPPGALILRL
ncbi:MAG: hypothetical protein WB799_13000 [Candidatus Sulfotelmatobacter sp.]